MGVLPPLTPASVFTEWTVDPTAAAITVAAAILYVGGVRRLAHRKVRWAPSRSVCFASGLSTIVVATQSGLAAYDTVLFGAHVAQHILLGIAAPFFLALGAPGTLAVQATHRPTQVNIIRLLHSRVVRVLSNPVLVWILFAVSLFVLYFSPLYELSLRNGAVHAWVHVHFLVVGCLFFWVVIGVDPIPHRLPYGARLVMVLLTVPFHAFLGLALMSLKDPIAASWYAEAVRIGQPTALDDQHGGGALMWTVGDVVALAAGGVIIAQWVRAEDRRTRRLDRHLDALDAQAARGPDRPIPGRT